MRGLLRLKFKMYSLILRECNQNSSKKPNAEQDLIVTCKYRVLTTAKAKLNSIGRKFKVTKTPGGL
jgi:hypothetical protein